MAKAPKNQDEFSKKEADRRRDELAVRILHTPHKPRDEMKSPSKRTAGKGRARVGKARD
jgi:hypothetical protein